MWVIKSIEGLKSAGGPLGAGWIVGLDKLDIWMQPDRPQFIRVYPVSFTFSPTWGWRVHLCKKVKYQQGSITTGAKDKCSTNSDKVCVGGALFWCLNEPNYKSADMFPCNLYFQSHGRFVFTIALLTVERELVLFTLKKGKM